MGIHVSRPQETSYLDVLRACAPCVHLRIHCFLTLFWALFEAIWHCLRLFGTVWLNDEVYGTLRMHGYGTLRMHGYGTLDMGPRIRASGPGYGHLDPGYGHLDQGYTMGWALAIPTGTRWGSTPLPRVHLPHRAG